MTDLERELRATLIEAGTRAPVIDDLVSRSVAPVRRRRTWLASGLAAVTIVAVGVAIAVIAPSEHETPGVSTPSTPASTQTQTGALIGTWRPVEIVGYDNAKLPPRGVAAKDAASITFTSQGRWRGSDGCNGIGGKCTASDDGSITVDASGAQTLIGCANVPNRGVLGRAARFIIEDRSLTFYAADGHRLGTYEQM
jgi:heat shock protein HslJ